MKPRLLIFLLVWSWCFLLIEVLAMVDYHQKHPPTVQSNPIAIERTMFEEMTGEPFTYIEQLDIYQNYTSDPQSWTVPAKIRALADFCLLLFNANEFVYVY